MCWCKTHSQPLSPCAQCPYRAEKEEKYMLYKVTVNGSHTQNQFCFENSTTYKGWENSLVIGEVIIFQKVINSSLAAMTSQSVEYRQKSKSFCQPSHSMFHDFSGLLKQLSQQWCTSGKDSCTNAKVWRFNIMPFFSKTPILTTWMKMCWA